MKTKNKQKTYTKETIFIKMNDTIMKKIFTMKDFERQSQLENTT